MQMFPPSGADVVYDPEVVESLVKLLSEVLRGSSPELLVCSTVRNQETYGGFKQQLSERNPLSKSTTRPTFTPF